MNLSWIHNFLWENIIGPWDGPRLDLASQSIGLLKDGSQDLRIQRECNDWLLFRFKYRLLQRIIFFFLIWILGIRLNSFWGGQWNVWNQMKYLVSNKKSSGIRSYPIYGCIFTENPRWSSVCLMNQQRQQQIAPMTQEIGDDGSEVMVGPCFNGSKEGGWGIRPYRRFWKTATFL